MSGNLGCAWFGDFLRDIIIDFLNDIVGEYLDGLVGDFMGVFLGDFVGTGAISVRVKESRWNHTPNLHYIIFLSLKSKITKTTTSDNTPNLYLSISLNTVAITVRKAN
ncbi:hypothetical protein E2C01_073107 [Portunus trituberculatus]|uniref:Uncharacterized protein n=1 Tax=Portunus trituberculatus TaxID=210409 RepID=A0A5B7I908_PORTR|nr:hypothetical protein [Portunus trituberculatus]